ncbi:MAG: hypothetical protein M0015_00015 [Betaproteobacteria bacterium]|nr:hypothetical protein [Betaproteobacteria bacterium]
MERSADESFAPAPSAAFGALRGLLGAVWLLNAGFQAYAWLWPPREQAAAALLRAYGAPLSGAPAWLQPYLAAVVHGVQAAGPRSVALLMVLIDLVIALSLLSGRGLWAGAWLGIVYSAFCWSTLDSLGYPYAHGQTDPGVFVGYLITFVMVLAAHDRTARFPGERDADYDPFRAGRLLFGLLWAFDAALKWQPYFLTHFMAQLSGAPAGQPGWIAAYIGFVIAIVRAVGPMLVAIGVALLETMLALSLLSGLALRVSLPLGVLYGLAVWTTAEGWGGPYTSAGTGVRGNVIGNVIIYVIVFLYLWAASASAPRAKPGLSRLA